MRPGSPDLRWAILLTGPLGGEAPALPDVPEATGSSVYVTDVSRVSRGEDLIEVIATDFAVPDRMGDLNAVLSSLSDLDWAPNPAGYLWLIHGLPLLKADNHTLFLQIAHVLIHLCDRWRSRAVPFRILVHGDRATLAEFKDEVAREFRALRDAPIQWKVDFEEPARLERVDDGWKPAFGSR